MNPPIAIVLPPEVQAALPPGEPGTKPPPKASALPTLRKRVLDKGGEFAIHADLDGPLSVESPDTRGWLEAAMDAVDTRRLGLAMSRFRQHAWGARDEPAESLMHWLALQHGVGAAFDTLLHAARWVQRRGNDMRMVQEMPAEPGYDAIVNVVPQGSLWQFRTHWMRADAAARDVCMASLRAQWSALLPGEQARFAIALPEARDLAAQLWDHLSPERRERSSAWLRQAAGLPLAEAVRTGHCLLAHADLQAVLVRDHGPDMLPTWLSLSDTQTSEALGWSLAAYDTPEATAALTRLACKDAKSLKALAWVCAERPEAALAPLLGALDDRKLPRGGLQRLNPLLKTLAASLGDRLPALLQDLPAGARKRIEPMAEHSSPAGDAAFAPRAQWPDVLASPPWTRPRPADAASTGVPGLPVLPVDPQTHWDADMREIDIQRYGPPIWQQVDEILTHFAGHLQGWTVADLKALADAPEKTNRLIADWLAAWRPDRPQAVLGESSSAVYSAWSLPDAAALAFWNAVGSRYPESLASAYVARFGTDAVPGLLNVLREGQDTHDAVLHIGAVELAPFVAQMLARRPARRAQASRWLLRFAPHAAAGLLAAALGEEGDARSQARGALRVLARGGQGDALLDAARRYDDPAVLDGVQALLAQDPLDDYPPRINARSKLPAFWQPGGWRRPRLREGGGALPDEALPALGLMMSFAADSPEGYAGLNAVMAACEPQSLADFAWDACEAWEAAGATAPGNWALRVQGVLGTDETARRLGALVRRWSAPGGGGTATRIGWVLDTLARQGGEAALLQLDAIARRNRIAAVRQQASERLRQLAAEQGLSEDELQDRLVPDLGLDVRGGLLLDFGPRQFHVGFDEALVPHVRESVDSGPGPRLATAPRPRASDDAERAADAVARFKALKEDAATIAAQQPLRLERAMCEGRRWTLPDFRRFLADHPLMRHLAQRLVWGVVRGDAASGGAASVQPLAVAFRVSAEGEWTDADDAPWQAPAEADAQDLRIVVAHPLQLSAEQIAGFAQQFSDYELIQPFDQVHRAVHAPQADEPARETLTRWVGRTVHPGPLWGLEARGWQRGYGDGGVFTHAWRRFADGSLLTLYFGPGLEFGGAGASRSATDQTLGELRASHPIGQMSPIAFSEAVRDLEALGSR